MSSSRSSRRSSTGATTLNIATIGLLDKGRLVKELTERGLETTGNKDTLSQRLYDFVVNGGTVVATPSPTVKTVTPKRKAQLKKTVKVEEPEEDVEEAVEVKPVVVPRKAAPKKTTPRGRPKKSSLVEIEDDAPDLQMLGNTGEGEKESEESDNLKSVTTRSGRKTTIKVETPEPESSPSPSPDPEPESIPSGPSKSIKVEPESTPTPPPKEQQQQSEPTTEPTEKRVRRKSPEPVEEKPKVQNSGPGAIKRPRVSSAASENEVKRSRVVEKEKVEKQPAMKPKPATWKEQWAMKMKEMKKNEQSNSKEEKPKVVEKRKESTEAPVKRKDGPAEKVDVISAIMSSTIPKPKPVKSEESQKPLRIDTEHRAHGGSDSSNRSQKPSPWMSNSPAQPSPRPVVAPIIKQEVPPPPPKNALGQARDAVPPPPPPKVAGIPPPPPPKVNVPPPPPPRTSLPPPPPQVKLEPRPAATVVNNVPLPSASTIPENIPLPAAISAQPRRRSRFDQPPPEYVQKYYQDMYAVATPPPKLATMLQISTPQTPPKKDLKSRIAEVFELDLKPTKNPEMVREEKEKEERNKDREEDDEEEDEDFVIRETVVETETPVVKDIEEENDGEVEEEDEEDEEEEEYDPFENTTINSECVEYYPSFAQEDEDGEGPSTSQQGLETEDNNENIDEMEVEQEVIGNDPKDCNNSEEKEGKEKDEIGLKSPELSSSTNTSALDLLKLALPVLKSLTTNVEEEGEKEEDGDFCQIIEESVLLEEKEKENPEDVYYHGDPVPEIDEMELFEIAAGIKTAKKKEKKNLVQIPEEERLPAQNQVELDYYNANIHVKSAEDNIWKIEPFSQDGLALMWGSVRSNFGVKIGAKTACRRLGFQIEVESFPSIQHLPTEFVHETGDVRVGFSLGSAPLILGEYSGSWCISSSGKKATNNHFSDFKTTFGINDIVTCVIDFDKSTIEYWKNGETVGVAFENLALKEGDVVFPTICVKHTIVNVNFGQETDEQKWKIPSVRDWKFLTEIVDNDTNQKLLERTRQAPESKSACTVLMTVGLPGVGKTTWVRRYLSEHPHEHWTIISADVVVDSMRINGVARNRIPNLKRPDFLRGIIGKSMLRLISLAPRRRKNYVLDMSNCLLEKRKRKLMAFEDFNRKCMIFVPDEDVHLKRILKQEHEENEKLDTDALMQHKAGMSLPTTENDPCEDIIFIDPPAPYEHLAFERVAKMNQDCKGWLMTGNRKRGNGFHPKSNLTINTHTYSTPNSHMNGSGPPSDNTFSPRTAGFSVTHTTFQSSNSTFTPTVKENSPPVTIKTDLTKPIFINMSSGYNNRRSVDFTTPSGPCSSSNNPLTPSSRRPSIGESSSSPQIMTSTPRLPHHHLAAAQPSPLFPFPCDFSQPPPAFPPQPGVADLIFSPIQPPPPQQQQQFVAAIPPPNMHFAPPR